MNKISSIMVIAQMPLDQKSWLSNIERLNLRLEYRYQWMIVVSKDDGVIYQLRPMTGKQASKDYVNDWNWEPVNNQQYEVAGGHWMVDTLLDRDTLPDNYRKFGMFCSVINDDLKVVNGTYLLLAGKSDNDVLNNNNWILFSNKINELQGKNCVEFTNASEVKVEHNTGKRFIDYRLTDLSNHEFYAPVDWADDNFFIVHFTPPTSGRVYWNY